jgi:hypothetical protein
LGILQAEQRGFQVSYNLVLRQLVAVVAVCFSRGVGPVFQLKGQLADQVALEVHAMELHLL